MRILRILVLVAVCLPVAAHAGDVLFTNDGGTFTSNTGGTTGTIGQTTLSLSGSYLVGISGLSGLGVADQSVSFPGCEPGCLGMVTLTTGTLTTGVLNETGTFSSSVPIGTFGTGCPTGVTGPCGTFTVDGPGGMVFTGQLSSASWFKPSAGTFTLQGTVTNATLTINGVMYSISSAVTIDLTTNGTGEINNGNGTVSFSNDDGSTNFLSPVPEPGTLALLGTGLIAVGIFAKRVAAS